MRWRVVILGGVVVVAVGAGLVVVLTGPQWLQTATGWLSAAGMSIAALWGGHKLATTRRPRALADTAAIEAVEAVEAFSHEEDAAAAAIAETERAKLLALQGQALADTLGAALRGERCPRVDPLRCSTDARPGDASG